MPYAQTQSVQSPIDYEAYLMATVYTASPMAQDLWGLMRLGASWPGRKLDLVSSLNDEYWPPSDVSRWYEDVEATSDHVRACGATVSAWLDPRAYPGHNMHADRIARMLSVMAL